MVLKNLRGKYFKIMKLSTINLLNNIKKGIQHKRKFAIVENTKTNLEIIICLQKLGYIKTFKLLEENLNILVTLDFTNSGTVIYNLISFLAGSRTIKISYRTLFFLKQQVKGGTYILSTSKGILSDIEALKNKTGGILICWICS